MSKTVVLIIVAFLLVICILFSCYSVSVIDKQTQFSESKKELEKEVKKSVVSVNSGEFVKEFDNNQLAAEAKYTGLRVSMSGFVTNISEDILGDKYLTLAPVNDEYYFGTSVQCYFSNPEELLSIQNGQQVTVYGDFDSQMFNVILKRCSFNF